MAAPCPFFFSHVFVFSKVCFAVIRGYAAPHRPKIENSKFMREKKSKGANYTTGGNNEPNNFGNFIKFCH